MKNRSAITSLTCRVDPSRFGGGSEQWANISNGEVNFVTSEIHVSKLLFYSEVSN